MSKYKDKYSRYLEKVSEEKKIEKKEIDDMIGNQDLDIKEKRGVKPSPFLNDLKTINT
jgi:hypothetical protein